MWGIFITMRLLKFLGAGWNKNFRQKPPRAQLEHLFHEFVSMYDDVKKIEPIFADGVEGRKSLLEVLNALEDVLKKFHDKYMKVVNMYKSNLFYNSPIRGIY